jgi:hypothetical protein
MKLQSENTTVKLQSEKYYASSLMNRNWVITNGKLPLS